MHKPRTASWLLSYQLSSPQANRGAPVSLLMLFAQSVSSPYLGDGPYPTNPAVTWYYKQITWYYQWVSGKGFRRGPSVRDTRIRVQHTFES